MISLRYMSIFYRYKQGTSFDWQTCYFARVIRYRTPEYDHDKWDLWHSNTFDFAGTWQWRFFNGKINTPIAWTIIYHKREINDKFDSINRSFAAVFLIYYKVLIKKTFILEIEISASVNEKFDTVLYEYSIHHCLSIHRSSQLNSIDISQLIENRVPPTADSRIWQTNEEVCNSLSLSLSLSSFLPPSSSFPSPPSFPSLPPLSLSLSHSFPEWPSARDGICN